MGKKSKKDKQMKQFIEFITIIILIVFIFSGQILGKQENNNIVKNNEIYINQANTNFDIAGIPEYTNKIYITINDNIPYFEEQEYTVEAFENYSELDSLGRCGVAYANICKEIMPTEARKSISGVYPTGWVQAKYNGEYLYNRCHLIGHQLAGEDTNELNLITGTKYFNVKGMLPFENQVADYIDNNERNHVLYRVTPIFKEENLVANGVEIEAYSVEDNGYGICFNVFVYNIQEGINIDYKTGESWQK